MSYEKYLISEISETTKSFNAHRKAMDGISLGAVTIFKFFAYNPIEDKKELHKAVTKKISDLFTKYKPDMDSKGTESLKRFWISTTMSELEKVDRERS